MFQVNSGASWHIWLVLGTFLTAALSANKTFAESSCTLPDPVSSESLVNLALECSPSQRAVAARWQASQHRVDAAGRLADPKLRVSAAPETFGNEHLDDGYVAELSQSVPWPGTLTLEKQAASAGAEALRARVDEHQVRLAHKIRLAFADWLYHWQLLAINKEHQQLWREFRAVVESKYAAGTATKATVLQAKHEGHLLLEEAIELQATVERDASSLKQLVGLPANVALAIPSKQAWEAAGLSEEAFDQMLQTIEQQPKIQRLEAELAGSSAELALAKKDRYPDVSVMARYNSLWMNDDQRWMVGVGVNIPLDFGKRSSREASIRAEQDALRWDRRDLANELREQLFRAHSLWQQGREINQLYRQELLPLAEEHLTTALEAYRSGSDDFLSLLLAQRQSLSTQRRAELAAQRQFKALADLTAAAGLVWIRDWHSSERLEYSNASKALGDKP